MIRTYYYDISGVTEDSAEYSRLYDAAALCRKHKADRFRFFKDKCLCLAAGELLSRALEDFGSDLKEDEVIYGKKGKPGFNDGKLFYNISHSGHLAACVMSDEGPVGIDVEEISNGRMNVARRFFSKAEYEALTAADADEKRGILFTTLWTLKEACLKATGEGLSDDLSSLDFSPYIDRLPYFEAGFNGSSFSCHTLMVAECCVSICRLL